MDARAHFLTLARYHRWATLHLYEGHVDALSDEAYRRPAGLFFGSIHGTLNHLLVGTDLVWLPRFSRGVSPQDVQLSDEVEPDRARLRERLLASADRWIALVEGIAPGRYGESIHYRTLRGQDVALPFAATLAHVFNHGTHHRGQITAALTAMGQPCPELDLVYFLQNR